MATAQGEYLVGDAIEVTYQAVALATGKTITMSVYDEAHTLDAPKSGEMVEIETDTGRYYKSFTPDAEGIWTVMIINTTDGNGPVLKQYAVAGHSIDDIGDAVVAAKAVIDTITPAGPTKDEMDTAHGLLATPAEVAAELATYDGPTKDEMDSGHALLATPAQVATELGNYDAPTKAELDTAEGVITDAVAALDAVVDAGFAGILSPAMVG